MTCPCNTVVKNYVPPEGSRAPKIYIAGMVPGEEEAKEHRPFVGPAGKVLRSALLDAGIDIETEVRIFNVVACRTTDYNNPRSNRDPTLEEIENCKGHIFADIEKTQPKVILVMGKTALSAFVDMSNFVSVTKSMKEEYSHNGIRLKLGYHPSYIHRNGGIGTPKYKEYVNWFKQFSSNSMYEHELKSLTTMNSDQFLSWVPPAKHLGFDIEASSLETTNADFLICGLGFSDVDGNGYYVYLEDEKDLVKVSDKLKSIILNHTLYVFNFSYEGTALATKLQIHPYQWNMVDTRQAALVVGKKGSLKNIAHGMGFPDWEDDNSWVVECLDDLYKNIFNKTGKKEKIPLTRLRESWTSLVDHFKRNITEIDSNIESDNESSVEVLESPKTKRPSSTLGEKAEYLERVYSDPESHVDIEKLRSAFLLEADKKNHRLFFDLVPVNIISKYCAFDAFAAIKIHDKLYKEMDDSEKKALGYLNEHSELGTAISCTGIGWNVEKARYLDTYYQEKMLEAMKAFLNNSIVVNVLNLTTFDLIEINSSVNIKKIKERFNPNSNHISTRQTFSKIMNQTIGKRVYSLFKLHQELSLTPEWKFKPIKQKFVHLLREDRDPEVMKKIREEKRQFISGDEKNIIDIINLYKSYKKVKEETKEEFHGSAYLGMLYFFELEKMDETTIIPLYDAFTRIGGIDIDDKSTWVPEFEALYYFRLFKKVLKSYSTYLWGTTGMGEDVKLIETKDIDLVSPPRITPDWKKYIVDRKPLEEYTAIATWSYNINGADTNRWKGRYHVWPWQCELQDLKISRYETGLLAHVDYSQMEVRTIAALAGEIELLKAYEQGKDVHRFMASRIFNRPEDQIDDTERRYSKMLTFSILYGKTEQGVATDYFGGDIKKAKDLVGGFYSGFPKIAEFIKNQHQLVDNGEDSIRSIFGERIFMRIMGQMNSDKARISQLKKYAVNYPVQSSASHLAGLGINRLNKEAFERNLNIKVFGFIHDAVDIDFEVHDLFDLLDILNRRMELDIKKEFDIPVKIDVEIGHTGNQMMEFDIKERGEEKLVIEAKGSLLALKGIKTVLEKAEINYDIRIDSIKEEFISSQFLFMAKRAFSESLGTTVKVVKAKFVIYSPKLTK